MNDRLVAVLELAALRDATVLRLFFAAAVALISHGAVQLAPFPRSLRTVLLNIQAGALILVWVVVLVILGFMRRLE